jgi:hypothetical protein
MKSMVVLTVLSLWISACGQTQPASPTVFSASQISIIPTVSRPNLAADTLILCGSTITTVNGMSFLINFNTIPETATIMPDGTYGYPAYTNNWGVSIPSCSYEIVDGIPKF